MGWLRGGRRSGPRGRCELAFLKRVKKSYGAGSDVFKSAARVKRGLVTEREFIKQSGEGVQLNP